MAAEIAIIVSKFDSEPKIYQSIQEQCTGLTVRCRENLPTFSNRQVACRAVCKEKAPHRGEALLLSTLSMSSDTKADRSSRIHLLAVHDRSGNVWLARHRFSRWGDALPDMPLTHETVAKSTSATRSTYQALAAVRASSGAAVTSAMRRS
jgi:hypothetical protein